MDIKFIFINVLEMYMSWRKVISDSLIMHLQKNINIVFI